MIAYCLTCLLSNLISQFVKHLARTAVKWGKKNNFSKRNGFLSLLLKLNISMFLREILIQPSLTLNLSYCRDFLWVNVFWKIFRKIKFVNFTHIKKIETCDRKCLKDIRKRKTQYINQCFVNCFISGHYFNFKIIFQLLQSKLCSENTIHKSFFVSIHKIRLRACLFDVLT